MLSRLILLLLLACLALPAMASVPCHDGSAEMAGMAMPHEVPAPTPEPERKAIPVHACMGCIPPASLMRAVMAAPMAAGDLRLVSRSARFDAGPAAPPATPPPRG